MENLSPHPSGEVGQGYEPAAAHVHPASTDSNVAAEPIQTPHGCVLFDAKGRVLYANMAALLMTLCSEGVALTKEGLRARTPAENAELQRLLRMARPGRVGQLRRGGRIKIARGARPPIVLQTLPLSSHWLNEEFPGSTLMLIIDGERTAHHCSLALQDLYGLTPAEAALAVRIPGCRGLQKLADEMGLSLSTVRTQLQRTFEKTGAHRQAELVQLLSELQVIGHALGLRSPPVVASTPICPGSGI